MQVLKSYKKVGLANVFGKKAYSSCLFGIKDCRGAFGLKCLYKRNLHHRLHVLVEEKEVLP